MKRLSFLVVRGENDCYMVHGLDWATYAEGLDFSCIARDFVKHVEKAFSEDSRPVCLDFRFPDGSVVSLVA